MSTTVQSSAVFDENNAVAAGKQVHRQPRRALRNITNAKTTGVGGGKGGKLAKPGASRRVGLRQRHPNISSENATSKPRRRSTRLRKAPVEDDVTGMDLEELDDNGNVAVEPVPEQEHTVDPVDVADIHDELAVSEYVLDIMDYLKATETKYVPNPSYMNAQADLSSKMREILVDWLIEVHAKFKLRTETLYLCVNLIDRFLSKKEVNRNKLQLVGITALLLASKYEEIWAPEVRDFVYIADNTYTRAEILHMEGTMLSALEFHLTVPSVYRFLQRWVKVAGGDQKMMFLSCFLAESTLQKIDFLHYKNSQIAAAAVYLANSLTGSVAWDATLQRHTGYTEADLKPCVRQMYGLIQEEKPKYKGVRRKYANSKYMGVSRIQPGNFQF